MKRHSTHRWGMTEMIWPIAVVVLITIICFILLAKREMNLRRTQSDIVSINSSLYQSRVMLSRSYMTYLLRSAGDVTVRREQLNSYFSQCLSAIDDAIAIRSGWLSGDNDNESSSDLKRAIAGIREELVTFQSHLVKAYDSGAGPDLDQRTRYMLLIQNMSNLNDIMQTQISSTYQEQDRVVRISIGIWAGSMAGVLLLLVMSSLRRSRMERALRESEERFRATFNQAAMGLALVAPDGAWLMVNDTLCRFLEYTEQELRQKRFQDITHPEDLAGDINLMDRLIAGQIDHYSIEKRYFRKDGSTVWANLTVALMRNPIGDPRYFISVVEDIGERKRIQADRDELLERERRARADAESANRAKDHFLAVVSHELRTPLTPVITGLDLLSQDKKLFAEHHETIGMMRRNIEAESQIISDLLDVVRLSNNKIELRHDIVDMHRLLREVEQTFRIGMQGKMIQWSFDLRAGLTTINGDALRLTQAFTNLLSNAVKFTPEGGHVTITTSNPSPTLIRVQINDDGIGIEPEVIERLFRPFEQAEISLARRFGGLGLGLSIARGLIELQSGTIHAQSDGLGKGASFIIEFPITTSPISVKDAVGASRPANQKKLLVVEDNSDTAQALVRLLKSLGHEVTLATTGAEGLALAARGGFDLLLSDIGLPDFSGWELIRRLRQTNQVPAIALSGFGTEEDQRRSRDAGFIAHLVKPLDIIRLERVINETATGSQQPG